MQDRDKEIEYLRLAINLCGLRIGYVSADLLQKAITCLNKMGKQMGLKEASEIQFEHNEKWKKYFEDRGYKWNEFEDTIEFQDLTLFETRYEYAEKVLQDFATAILDGDENQVKKVEKTLKKYLKRIRQQKKEYKSNFN